MKPNTVVGYHEPRYKGLSKVQIQGYMVGCTLNIKRLAFNFIYLINLYLSYIKNNKYQINPFDSDFYLNTA